MNEIQQPTERRGDRLFRCIARPDDSLLENLLNAESRECRARGENPLFGVTNQNRRESPESHLMRSEDIEAGLQGEDEAVTPPAGRHIRGLARIIGRQFVVERDDHGLLAREVAIQEADADPRLFRDIAKRCRLIAASGDQLYRRGI